MKLFFFLALSKALLFPVGLCVTPFLNYYLDETSKNVMRSVFLSALESNDLSAIHYGAAGLKAADVVVEGSKSQALCSLVKKVDGKDLVSLYHAAGAAAALHDCQLTVPEAQATVEKVLRQESPSSQTIYVALAIAENLKLGLKYDSFAKLLTNALTADDSSSSLAYGLNAAALMDKKNAEKFFVRVEDLVGQADEVDSKYLHLEDGLSVTAFGVYGIYALADKINKSPNVKSDEAVKLASYLLSRRTVQSSRDACLLMETLKKLANNNFQIPVVFSLASDMAIMDTKKPLVIRVSNVLGESVGPLSVTLDAATHSASKEIFIVRERLKRVVSDETNTLYEVSVAEAKQRGFYTLAFTAGSQDKRLVGTNGASLTVKVVVKVQIEDVSLAVFDREIGKSSTDLPVKEGSKIGRTLEADVHSKMEIRFKVKEAATGETILVHQAFVIFVHSSTRQEIIFVATPDRENYYLFDADFEKVAKDFEGLSGKYAVRLVVGDVAISNPIDWNLVDINLKLPAISAPKIKKSERIIYEKLPEIRHMFREPEKRPPQIVSTTFIVLCAVPLLILIFLWLRIGINFGNLPSSPFVVLFHGGLTSIFGLYFVFWLRLNMFETLKYLSAIGTLTFISGNRLLRTLAARRREKAD